jgi:hypothetical protein
VPAIVEIVTTMVRVLALGMTMHCEEASAAPAGSPLTDVIDTPRSESTPFVTETL